MPLSDPLDRLLTLRARPVQAAGAALPGVVVPARRFQWYYACEWPDGTLAATLHLGEGIVPRGETGPWRILRRDRTRTLLQPGSGAGTLPAASCYPGGSGVDGDFFRITDGESRVGGFDVLGRGWRGGVVQRRDTRERVLLLRGDGDPPDVYYLDPIPRASCQPSLASLLLLAYVLTERELREGSWVKRP